MRIQALWIIGNLGTEYFKEQILRPNIIDTLIEVIINIATIILFATIIIFATILLLYYCCYTTISFPTAILTATITTTIRATTL